VDHFLAPLYQAERGIAEHIRRLGTGTPAWAAFDADKAIPWVEGRLAITLAPSRRDAVRLALASKLLVITGGPGVGKTTLVNSILTVLRAKQVKALLCAPTGRAAKRLSESTGLEARTIHRLLEIDPKTGQFKRSADSPRDCDLLVAAEVSMIDVPLGNQLLRAVATRSAVIYAGLAIDGVRDDDLVDDLLGDGSFDHSGRDLEELDRQWHQFRVGQPAVALGGRLGQRVGHAGLGAQGRVQRDADLLGDGVHGQQNRCRGCRVRAGRGCPGRQRSRPGCRS
jgi:ATP-dependent exoDNAse (exonuclease V) alpha subunit